MLNEDLYLRKLTAIHTIDHLRRLIDRCQEKRSRRARESELEPLGRMLLRSVQEALSNLADIDQSTKKTPEEMATAVSRLKKTWEEFEIQAEEDRDLLIGQAAIGGDARLTIGKLDTLRWIRRVSYHVWRIMHYLSGEAEEEVSAAEMPPSEPTD